MEGERTIPTDGDCLYGGRGRSESTYGAGESETLHDILDGREIVLQDGECTIVQVLCPERIVAEISQ